MKGAKNVVGDRILQKNAGQARKLSGVSDPLKDDANELFGPAAEDALPIEGNLEVADVVPIEGNLEVETGLTVDIVNIAEEVTRAIGMADFSEGTQEIEEAFHAAEIVLGKVGSRTTREAPAETEREIIVIKKMHREHKPSPV